MKRLMMTTLFLLILTGCASNVALKDSADVTQAVGTLSLSWLQANSMEVTLEGKRYVGEWTSEPCLNEYCRGVYRNVQKLHRRHIDKGYAILKSKDGGQLECVWVSHLPDVQGECRAQDGRQFRLKAG